MTMRTASKRLTPCEMLRRINDLCQEDTESNKEIRELLHEFMVRTKRLTKELNSRPGPRVGEKWWEHNEEDWRALAKSRMEDTYRTI